MSLFEAIIFVVVGIAAGALSTSFGIGGGAISTPAIRALGISAITSIGTTLPSVLPGVLTGMMHFRGQQLIRYRVVLAVAIPGVVASVAGSLVSHRLPGNGHLIMIITAAILMLNAFRISKAPREAALEPTAAPEKLLVPEAALLSRRNSDLNSAEIPEREPPALWAESVPRPARHLVRLGAIGILAGLISGMLGLGGGIVLVPMFVQRLGLSLRESTATSLVCVGVLAIPSIITHTYIGDIDWTVSALLTLGTIPGAHLGAKLALRVSELWLRRSAALVLSVVALVYGASEVIALLR